MGFEIRNRGLRSIKRRSKKDGRWDLIQETGAFLKQSAFSYPFILLFSFTKRNEKREEKKSITDFFASSSA